ncbi:MAG: sel1 repeat family protein [Rickettsiales bacterium]|nr:sel1 repeat family protein [Rickettsiales bacterium]
MRKQKFFIIKLGLALLVIAILGYAILRMGALYIDNMRINKGVYFFERGNVSKAKDLWLKMAKKGNLKAEYNLGILYNSKKDFEKAIKWFKKAAQKGSPDAQFALGSLYRNKGNFKEAIRWFRKAAQKEVENSQVFLGGLLLQEKTNELEKCFEKPSLERKNSLCGLRILYGLQGELEEAEKWLVKATKKYPKNASFFLGMLYAMEKKPKTAITWLTNSANYGDEKAQSMLKKLDIKPRCPKDPSGKKKVRYLFEMFGHRITTIWENSGDAFCISSTESQKNYLMVNYIPASETLKNTTEDLTSLSFKDVLYSNSDLLDTIDSGVQYSCKTKFIKVLRDTNDVMEVVAVCGSYEREQSELSSKIEHYIMRRYHGNTYVFVYKTYGKPFDAFTYNFDDENIKKWSKFLNNIKLSLIKETTTNKVN